MRTAILFVCLYAYYLALSGQFDSPFLMKVGVVCCAATALVAKHMGIVDDESLPFRYWLRTAVYAPWLWWQIVLSNLDVARRVWSPRLPIAPRMFKLPHDLHSVFGMVTYANSITLTPGTVTVEVSGGEFLIHALTKEAQDDLESGEMHKRVKWIEGDTKGDTR
ncbi:MAG: Na+/H+ antiporter subunit E [Nannocystaceae bacterium]